MTELVKPQRVPVLPLTSYLPRGLLGLGVGLLAPALRLKAQGAVPAGGASYDRLSRAEVNRVAGTVVGSSGHGCFG